MKRSGDPEIIFPDVFTAFHKEFRIRVDFMRFLLLYQIKSSLIKKIIGCLLEKYMFILKNQVKFV